MDTRSTVSILVAAAFLGGSPAYAQDVPSADPAEGSPSGLQYELPVDGARKDASPSDKPRGDRPGTGDESSPLRSENGLGTSSEVPGADASAAGEGDDAASGKKGSGSDKDGDGKGGATGGSGDADADADELDESDIPRSDPAPASDATNGVQAGLLLGLSALVGGGVGIAARRSRRG
jgi:hypothetical protein